MSTFIYCPTADFAVRLKKIEKLDRPGHARIMAVIGRLLEHPADADGKMVGVHHGRLKKYVGRRDYRLIYQWCAECRKVRREDHELCDGCDTFHDHSVIFFDVYHKNEMNKLR